MAATRCMAFVLGTAMFAGALTASFSGCTHGDYDGSYEGGVDSSMAADGSAISRVVQPDKTEVVTSTDGAFDVTFLPGTFAAPTTVTVTFTGEHTLSIGLTVPTYAVTADQQPKKIFQVDFHGSTSNSGGQSAPAAAVQVGSTFQQLPVVGSADANGSFGSYWGLSTQLGSFSLVATQSSTGQTSFSDTLSTCTGACCAQKGATVTAGPGGCSCATGPDLACFVEHCADLAGAGARCTSIAAGSVFGNAACKPFGANTMNCPGPGCNGYPGNCGTGGGMGPGNSVQTCCISKNSGSCVNSPQACAGFAAHCTATTGCAPDMTCCVFESESYCAKTCPTGAQRACDTSAECNDAGVDAGPDAATCNGGGCPVGVCGTLPAGCK